MNQVTTLVEEYEEHFREVANWRLQIIAYKLGEKFVCIVNNLDPGATVCRVCASTRQNALRDAVQQANSLLARTVMTDAAGTNHAEVMLSRLEYVESGAKQSYSVQEFISLDMPKRMEYILSGKLTYFSENDQVLSSGDAMRLLQKACQPAA